MPFKDNFVALKTRYHDSNNLDEEHVPDEMLMYLQITLLFCKINVGTKRKYT